MLARSCFFVLLFVLVCSCRVAKENKDTSACTMNPHRESEKQQWHQWEMANWQKSCARLINPYSTDYVGLDGIKN